MKILIGYSTKTGNTQKIAEAISLSLPEAELLNIQNIKNLDYDLFIIGGWIDKGTFDMDTLSFIEKIKDKKIAYFFTLGAATTSPHAQNCINNIDDIFLKNNNTILKRYFCQGAIDPKLIEKMLTLPAGHVMSPTKERMENWKVASTHPNEKDLECASIVFKNIKNFI